MPKASQESKILNFNRVIDITPKYIKGLESVITFLKDNPQKIEPKIEKSKDNNKSDKDKVEKKENINHNIKVYDSANEFTTYPDYVSVANAIKGKIGLSEDGYLVEHKNNLKQSQAGLDFLNSSNERELFSKEDQEESVT